MSRAGTFAARSFRQDGVASPAAATWIFSVDTSHARYKIWLDGRLLGCGPGRGEAPLATGPAAYAPVAYDAYEVTSLLGETTTAIAVAGVASKDASPQRRGVLVQIDLVYADGSRETVATDESWMALDADAYAGPTPGSQWYHVRLENYDARREPESAGARGLAWRTAPLDALSGAWAPAVADKDWDPAALAPKMARPLTLVDAAATATLEPVAGTSLYIADFGKEFQGGLTFATDAGVDGAVLKITTGESQANGTVGDDWGFQYNVTLRGGAQTVELQQYQEFRFASRRGEPAGRVAATPRLRRGESVDTTRRRRAATPRLRCVRDLARSPGMCKSRSSRARTIRRHWR